MYLGYFPEVTEDGEGYFALLYLSNALCTMVLELHKVAKEVYTYDLDFGPGPGFFATTSKAHCLLSLTHR